MIHTAVLIMVKNERKRLNVTLESIKKFADSLIIYDTGSTDETIQICKDFSAKYNIPLRVLEGEFVNFEVSRNVSLDFADSFEDVDYLLLLDTNDELKGGDELKKVLIDHKKSGHKSTGFFIRQNWFFGKFHEYYNVRIVQAHKNWRYKGCVHEYIKTDEENGKYPIIKLDPNIFLFQDRTQDDDKSGKRFIKDKELLLKEFEKDPTEPRTVFYLAQTFGCLNDQENAFKYYKIRTKLDGFYEEKYLSFYNCGDLSQELKYDWSESMDWYMKAFECIVRAEPLLRIGEHYQVKKNWRLAYMFYDHACTLEFPYHCHLFIDKLIYEYKRWHLLGIVAYYNNCFERGKYAVLKAIENGEKNNIQIDLDKSNLKFYMEKENKDGKPEKKKEKKKKEKKKKEKKKKEKKKEEK